MAGRSSRFPNTRPKWMLTHPMTSNLMCVESIKGINLDFFDKIYFTFLSEHEDKYQITKGLTKSLNKLNISNKVELIILDNATKSQSETVYLTIRRCNIEGFIMVKDSDNFFQVNIDNVLSQICYFDLNNIDYINAKSKSYLCLDSNKVVNNIVEKKVISPYFSVGGYCFHSAKKFCDVFEDMDDIQGECFLSHLIFKMILQGEIFAGKEASHFIDWGTQTDWSLYCNKFSTVFIDLDGTLITNSSDLIPPYIGEGLPIVENIYRLNELYIKGETKIIITTSRPEEYRDITISELKRHGINHDLLIMGLPHCKRVLINDFADSNPYPSSIAINIERNKNNLSRYI